MNKFKIKELFFKVLSILGHYNKLCEYKQFKYKGETYKISIYERNYNYNFILFDKDNNPLECNTAMQYNDRYKGLHDPKENTLSFPELIKLVMEEYELKLKRKEEESLPHIAWDDGDSEYVEGE